MTLDALARAGFRGEDSDWYALYTRHQHEKTVAGILSGKGFEVFLPLYRALHRWQDRRKLVELPLFPGYVFLQGGLERRLQVVSTPGVIHVVGAGGHPAPIPSLEIDAIRRTLDADLRTEPCPFLRVGDRVRVIAGPLAGIEAILVREKSLHRLVLSVDLLQKSVAVEIPVGCVEPIDPQYRPADANWIAARIPAGA